MHSFFMPYNIFIYYITAIDFIWIQQISKKSDLSKNPTLKLEKNKQKKDN